MWLPCKNIIKKLLAVDCNNFLIFSKSFIKKIFKKALSDMQ